MSMEFVSSEISQILRGFMENLNRSNMFCTNLKAQVILAPALPRIDTGHVSHAKYEISQQMRTPASSQVPRCIYLIEIKLLIVEFRDIFVLFYFISLFLFLSTKLKNFNCKKQIIESLIHLTKK